MKQKSFLNCLAVVLAAFACVGTAVAQESRKNPIVCPWNPVRTVAVGSDPAGQNPFSSRAIQDALDALRNTGGVVKLLPGTYDVTAPIRLYSNTALVGSGPSTVLKKCKGVRTRFVVDADYGELFLTVQDPTGFVPGMGVQIYDSDQDGGWDVTTAVITAVENNVLFIDNHLVRDYRSDRNGIVSNACSVVSAVEADHVTIADLTVDGSRESNDALNGCRGGGVYLHKVKNATVANVIVRNFDADGISWQITEDVVVRNCEIAGCANSGLHPGTGSPRTTIEGNDSHHNDRFGLFICWRVQNAVVRNNRFRHNGLNGICTGHKDTDVLFEGNRIHENGGDGANFRGERPSNAPHRNTFRNNTVENNGLKNGGYGFSFESRAENVVLENNTIRNTEGGKQKAAVYVGRNGLPVTLKNNTISGHALGDVMFEKKTGGE